VLTQLQPITRRRPWDKIYAGRSVIFTPKILRNAAISQDKYDPVDFLKKLKPELKYSVFGMSPSLVPVGKPLTLMNLASVPNSEGAWIKDTNDDVREVAVDKLFPKTSKDPPLQAGYVVVDLPTPRHKTFGTSMGIKEIMTESVTSPLEHSL
jgi:hypothetical protein